MGFPHIGQTGLELLTSGDLPDSASQNVEITGMSHCTQSLLQYFVKTLEHFRPQKTESLPDLPLPFFHLPKVGL